MSYETLVAESFQQKSALPFSNENATHARVIMKHIFLNANENVALFSDELPSSVEDEGGRSVEVYDWPELVDAARGYLMKSSKCKLRIKVKLTREKSANPSKELLDLANTFASQVTIDWGSESMLPNFMANDTGAFRVELKKHQAVACAYNLDVANKLLVLHDEAPSH